MKPSMKNEEWREIPGYEGRYEVSDQGRVRNAVGHCLKPQKINSGYFVVHLYREGKRRIKLVHIAVAEAFVPNPEGKPEVNHENTYKLDNIATNLEWSTRLENVAHAIAAGLVVEKPNAIAVIGTPIDGGPTVQFPSQKDAEIALAGKQSSAINHCFSGKKKSAYGYTWRVAT